MLERDLARSWCERVLAASRADACEVALGGGADALTRFANNEIHQSMASESYDLSVRSRFGRRTGRASTTRLDADGVARVVAESERTTRLMPERDDLLDLPGPQEYRAVPSAWDDVTAGLGAAARADVATRLIAAAAAAGFEAAGFVRAVRGRVGDYGERGTIALANSNGLFAYHRQTTWHVAVTVMGLGVSGWAEAEAHAADAVDAEALVQVAIAKARGAATPQRVPPGEYTVVLEPAAVADLIGFLAQEWSATVVDEGRSCFSGRLGAPLFESNLRLWDDAYHELHAATPFDEEGMPVRRVLLVDAGVPCGLVYDRAAALRHGVAPSGHALRVPSTEGAIAANLVLEGGAATLESMIATTRRGILVTRLWYCRPVDARQLLVTGMTRDGTYWIEDGAVRHGLVDLRFNQSVLEMLRQVRALGTPVRALQVVAPPLLVDGFRFTSLGGG